MQRTLRPFYYCAVYYTSFVFIFSRVPSIFLITDLIYFRFLNTLVRKLWIRLSMLLIALYSPTDRQAVERLSLSWAHTLRLAHRISVLVFSSFNNFYYLCETVEINWAVFQGSEDRGIVPRTCEHLFREIMQRNAQSPDDAFSRYKVEIRSAQFSTSAQQSYWTKTDFIKVILFF